MLRYKTETRPGLVALYDIWPGNGAGLFLQPEPARATGPRVYKNTSLTKRQTEMKKSHLCRTQSSRKEPSATWTWARWIRSCSRADTRVRPRWCDLEGCDRRADQCELESAVSNDKQRSYYNISRDFLRPCTACRNTIFTLRASCSAAYCNRSCKGKGSGFI